MIVYFNRRKQWLDIQIHDVHPTTFERKNGTYWAYYEPAEDRHPRKGLFGSLHFVKSRLTPDTIAHELIHVLADWLRAKDMQITPQNEERLAWLFDELTRNTLKATQK